MKTKILLTLFLLSGTKFFSQTYPTFGNEIPVTINGLTFDAMEPSISADGNFLFFNSLNDGNTTSLYYATRVNDSTFTFVGALTGADETVSPRLDAVASSDSANDFYWVSLRNFPSQFDNYFHGTFNGSDVIDTGRVHGTFYIYTIGWLIMDAAINYNGNLLYYCNAYFNTNYAGCSGLPCQAKLGVAQKVNDSTFNKLSNSDGMMMNVNDTVNYIVYAPFVTKDGLELYFTRALHTPTQSEICVAVRNTPADTFSLPSVIYASPNACEAPTLTTDKSKMYYHQKSGGIYKIFLRYRTAPNGMGQLGVGSSELGVFPNPTSGMFTIKGNFGGETKIEVFNSLGQVVGKWQYKAAGGSQFDLSNQPTGIYFVRIISGDKVYKQKVVKE